VSRRTGVISRVATLILPEILIRRKLFEGRASLCLKTDRSRRVSEWRPMLAEQFLAAAAGARNSTTLDETARLTWRAHAEGKLADADAEAISGAVRARRATLAGEAVQNQPKAILGLPRGCRPRRHREKLFGMGRPRALDRNAKVRIMHWARCLARRTEKGKAYGQVTAKALAVLEALLWGFHNAKSGVCFPSYERIAEAAGCARSTVAQALKALEDAKILSWVQRIKRVREPCPDLLGANGWRWRVLRTSNAYAFNDPSPAGAQANSSKSEKETGTPNQEFFSSIRADRGVVVDNGGGHEVKGSSRCNRILKAP
jgi:hypothetical protein